MGTRADFYVNDGPQAEWLGSIAWDGYPDGIPDVILNAEDEAGFRSAVAGFIAGREDGTTPQMGWPWPWNDSGTTDCCYAFKNGEVMRGRWGTLYRDPEADDPSEVIGGNFPDMSDRKAMTMGKRSGVIVLGSP